MVVLADEHARCAAVPHLAREGEGGGTDLVDGAELAERLAAVDHDDRGLFTEDRRGDLVDNGSEGTLGSGVFGQLAEVDEAKATSDRRAVAEGEPPPGGEKWYRDAKIYTIFEGTSEMQRKVIARMLTS